MADPVRICVIGNSHMAALRDGWPLVEADHPGLRLSFFGLGQYGLRRTHAEDTRLVPDHASDRAGMRRACGVEEIDTAGYDGFVLVGLWRGLRWIEMMLCIASIASIAGRDGPDGGLEGPARMLVSFEAAEAAAHDALMRAPLPHVTGILRSMWGDPPIYALPMPRLGADALIPGAPPAIFAAPDVCSDALARGTAGDWRAMHDRLLARFDGPWPVFIDQPAATVERDILTRPEFRRGAPGWSATSARSRRRTSTT